MHFVPRVKRCSSRFKVRSSEDECCLGGAVSQSPHWSYKKGLPRWFKDVQVGSGCAVTRRTSLIITLLRFYKLSLNKQHTIEHIGHTEKKMTNQVCTNFPLAAVYWPQIELSINLTASQCPRWRKGCNFCEITHSSFAMFLS